LFVSLGVAFILPPIVLDHKNNNEHLSTPVKFDLEHAYFLLLFYFKEKV